MYLLCCDFIGVKMRKEKVINQELEEKYLILEKERTDTNPKKLVETARLYLV